MITEEEKKAIDKLNRQITIGKCENNIGIPVYISSLEIILNLITKLQEENKKKDKVINLMSECIYDNDNFYKLKCAFEKIEKRKRT